MSIHAVTPQGAKKPSFRDIYRDYVYSAANCEPHSLNDKQRSHYLIKSYISRIYNASRGYISDEDIERGLVDASNDAGVDFIYRDDGVVLIIQAKYSKRGNTVRTEDITHFQSVLRRLYNPQFIKNRRLADALSEVDFENDTFVLVFITLGRLDGQASVQSEAGPLLPDDPSDIQDRVTCEYLDEGILNEELRSALLAINGLPGRCRIYPCLSDGKRTQILEVKSGEHRSCLMVVPAKEIIELWRQFKDSLFSLNVRNYIGGTRTNKAIIQTAVENPEEFFFYNNGISCLGTRVEVSNDRSFIDVDGLQVINGAQTVKSLVRSSHKREGDPLLLLRVTEVAAGYSSEGRFRNSVIRFNNTQNVIKVSDFRSNDPVQNDLGRRFGEYTRLGRSVCYLAKRSESPRNNSISIRLEDFAKTIYSFLYDPIAFSGATSFLFDEGDNGGYAKVFGDGKQVWTIMPDDEFRLRSAVWWMSGEFAEKLAQERRSGLELEERIALERRWVVLFAARLVLQRSFGTEEYKEYLCKRYRGDWRFGEGETGGWFRDLYQTARQSVIYVYKQAAKTKDFSPRLWWRSGGTVEDLTDFIQNSPFAGLRKP